MFRELAPTPELAATWARASRPAIQLVGTAIALGLRYIG